MRAYFIALITLVFAVFVLTNAGAGDEQHQHVNENVAKENRQDDGEKLPLDDDKEEQVPNNLVDMEDKPERKNKQTTAVPIKAVQQNLATTAGNLVTPIQTEPKNLQDLQNEIKHLHQELAEIKSKVGLKLQSYPKVKYLNYKDRKRVLVTGGSGFVGSHLVDYLMQEGHEVVALDNHFTGRRRNIEHWFGHANFELVHHDVVNPFYIEVDQIYHLASPASPPHYMYNPVKTIKTNTLGTMNMLGLARRTHATVLLASTSEVYGDPEVHPQPETYWGHVNPVGPRACYDEGKRIAETLMVAYNKQENVNIRIARIFNTFGPRMHMNDGRVVSNFIVQALQNKDITVYGNGNQTRSFQYVTDLVRGLVMLMNSNVSSPVNIGNPEEHTIEEFAQIIKQMTNSSSKIVHNPKPVDDPQQRRPDITKAAKLLGWKPEVKMLEGIRRTIDYFAQELQHNLLNEGGMVEGGAASQPRAAIEHFIA